jgi:hypothetical protein
MVKRSVRTIQKETNQRLRTLPPASNKQSTAAYHCHPSQALPTPIYSQKSNLHNSIEIETKVKNKILQVGVSKI